MKLASFFHPKAVAVIGASADRTKIGRQVVDNLIAGGYGGAIYPINLQERKIAGRRAFASLENIPQSGLASLLVIIAIPAPLVVPEVEKCGRLGIKNIVIISAGFKETDTEGAKREDAIYSLAEKYNLNILGPNCLGFINNLYNLNASFSSQAISFRRSNISDKTSFPRFSSRSHAGGRIALLSQSGAIGSAALDWLKEQGTSIAYFISLGNKAVLDESDFLEYLASDKNIDAIIFYLEDVRDGQRFMSAASRLAAAKPLIVLKAGFSTRGKSLAKSHTGALAGAAASVKAALERAGVLVLERLEDLFGLITVLQSPKAALLSGADFNIITNAGGLAVLSADEAAHWNLNLSQSIDVLGNADAQAYQEAIKSLTAKKKTGIILILLTPQAATRPQEVAQAIIKASVAYPRLFFLASFSGGSAVSPAKAMLSSAGIPVFSYPEQAIKALGQLKISRELRIGLSPFRAETPIRQRSAFSNDYLALFRLLQKSGIPVVKTEKFFETSSNFSDRNFPMVLKAVGPDFNHKTDIGGVVLNIKNNQELRRESVKLRRRQAALFKNPENYLVVQPQIKAGLELIIGLKRDVSFGPLLLVGLGGVYAEIFQQSELVVADLNPSRAVKLLNRLSFAPILRGARGGTKYDIKQLAKILSAFSRLATAYPEIREFDINPLFLTERGAVAGDARAVIK